MIAEPVLNQLKMRIHSAVFWLLIMVPFWTLKAQNSYDSCYPPRNLHAYTTNRVVLAWSKPLSGGDMLDFIYDDGTFEGGWTINPGWVAWMGNEFRIPGELSGLLKSFDLYFLRKIGAGTDSLTLDIFDSTRTLVGSSDPFHPPDSDWISLTVNDIPFSGKFYAMVKWDSLSNYTNFLTADTDGPYQWDYLNWYYDGTDWYAMQSLVGCCTGVFLLRAHAQETTDGRITAVRAEVTGLGRENEEAIPLKGYNVYRFIDSTGSGTGSFYKINSFPLFSTFYADYPPDLMNSAAYYYTTAIYENDSSGFICESGPSDTIVTGNPSGIGDLHNSDELSIFPNPVRDYLFITSVNKIVSLEVESLSAGKTMTFGNPYTSSMKMDVSKLPTGLYILKARYDTHYLYRKFLISR